MIRSTHVAFVMLAIACREPEAEGKADLTSSVATASASQSAASAEPAAEGTGIPLTGAGHGSAVSQRDRRDPRSSTDTRYPIEARMRMGAVKLQGGELPPEAVQRPVRSVSNAILKCYQTALVKQPTLAGQATTRFTVDQKGHVQAASTTGDLADKAALLCIQKQFAALTFAEPDGGNVDIAFPLIFDPPAYAFTIGGKNSVDASEADLVAALRAAGYEVADAGKAPPKSVSRFKATKDGVTFSLTLDPAATLPFEDYYDLTMRAPMLEDGAWVLFVESSERLKSRALIDAIHKKTRR